MKVKYRYLNLTKLKITDKSNFKESIDKIKQFQNV